MVRFLLNLLLWWNIGLRNVLLCSSRHHGVKTGSGMCAHETIHDIYSQAFSLTTDLVKYRPLCIIGETQCWNGAKMSLSFRSWLLKYIRNFVLSRDVHQMTEIFVSGTEVFSDAKMTEYPYEWRRVDMYESLSNHILFGFNVESIGPRGRVGSVKCYVTQWGRVVSNFLKAKL